jgi:hypothetical protein
MPELIISYHEARARGLKRYFTGKPCKYGHIAQRHVSNRKCIGCERSDDYRYISNLLRRQPPRTNPWAEARALGLTRYFTGKPCKYGHIAERLVSNRRCSVCLTILRREWDIDNPDKLSIRNARYYLERPGYREAKIAQADRWTKENPEASKASKARYVETHREQCNAAGKRCREAKPEYYRDSGWLWRLLNPDKNCAKSNRRRARKAHPPWADQQAIAAVYAACPPGMVIDHIIPLTGRTVEGYSVSGLHIAENLQYLTPEKNLSKHNRMRPEDQALCES